MAEALLRMAERVARLGAWRVDLPGFTSAWADEVRAIPEIPPGFVPIADTALEHYAIEDRQAVRAAAKACAELGKPFDLEVRFVTAGRQLWLRIIGEAVRDDAGVISWMEGAFQDVTARRHAEEEARRLSAVVADTLEHISDGFVTLAWCLSSPTASTSPPHGTAGGGRLRKPSFQVAFLCTVALNCVLLFWFWWLQG
jgi:PAS domain-containing protein